MKNGDITSGYLVRLVGLMGICVGAAWALQIVGFADHITAAGKLMWLMAAAGVSGASVGLIVVSRAIDTHETPSREVEPIFARVRT